MRAGVHFLSNDRKGEGLFLGQSIEYNLVATRLSQLTTLGVLRRARMRRQARRLAELVDVDTRRLVAPARALSGGNQQKVFVGRSLQRPRLDLLLLDDPTRGVDVGGRVEIHSLIRLAADAGATVIFASSELDEILELSDVVVTLFAGTIVSQRPRQELTAAQVLSEMTHRTEGDAA
jgi:ABC-type sugar transport system ATPase subunit